jgi:predicted permease
MNLWVRLSAWLHRRLARAFPHEFQVLYGNDLEQVGDDAVPYIWSQYGILGLLQLIASAAVSLVVEYVVEFSQDLRYAVRRLLAAPGFLTIGVLSLALSIGVSSLFLLQVAAMTKPAPGVGGPQALVAPENLVSYPYFEAYRAEEGFFSATAAFLGPTPFTVGVGNAEAKNARVFGHVVSLDYFSKLRVTPSAGRFFDHNADGPDSQPTVVVSDRFWRTRLDANPDAIGSTLRINGSSLTVIGIGPAGFEGAFPFSLAQLFIPISVGPAIVPELGRDLLHDPDATRFRALLRLADGVTAPRAQAALQVITKNLDEQKAEADRPREERTLNLMNAGITVPLPRQMRKLLWGLNGLMMAMILGIACANLAVLVLARGDERSKEIAIRLSVGASRYRIVRQLLTESLVLSMIGGLAVLIVVRLLVSATRSLQPSSEMAQEVAGYQFDWTTALIVLSVAVLAGLSFGLVPALSSTRGDLAAALKQGVANRLRGYRRFGLRNQLIVFQAAGSLMLLLVTGFVVVGYQQVYRVDPCFDTDELYVFALDPARDGYSVDQSARLLEELPSRLNQRPEVVSVALSLDVPFSQPVVVPNNHVTVREDSGENVLHDVFRQRIGEGYFSVLAVPLIHGREFDVRDQLLDEALDTPVVLNQTAAELLFSGEDPIGQSFSEDDRTHVVIGIAKDLKSGLMMATPTPTVFAPLTPKDFHSGAAGGATVILRGLAGASATEAAAAEIEAFDAGLSVFDVRTFDHDVDQFNTLIKYSSMMNGGIAVFGTILSVIGLFAVTLHAVARRRKEIGIRLALGARRDQILRLVAREGIGLVLVGGTIGFAGAYAMARAFSSVVSRLAEIFAVGAGDPLFVVGVPLAWAALALVACYLPARRAMSIDRAAKLKAE